MCYFTKPLLRTFILIAALSSVSSAQVKWQPVLDQEAGFTISFPGHPTYGESTAPETGQPLETYSFYYNGNTLHIAFGPVLPAPKTVMQVNKVLSDTAEVYARNAGNLLRQEKLPDGGRQFDNLVKTPSGTMHLRSRVYVRRGMMFTLSCGSYAQDGIDERVAEQFFSSFNFTGQSPTRQAAARGNTTKKSSPKVAVTSRWHTLSTETFQSMVPFLLRRIQARGNACFRPSPLVIIDNNYMRQAPPPIKNALPSMQPNHSTS